MTVAEPDLGPATPQPDLTTTLFLLPPDSKLLPVSELSPRLRARIGPVEDGQSVITRPGLRVMTRLVPGPLAGLVQEFRSPSLLTDAVARFARAHDQDPFAILDMAFEALAILVEARILVPDGSPDAAAPVPSLSAGQAFADYEIEALVRSLDDSEVYRARDSNGSLVALKVARDDRSSMVASLKHEAAMLEWLGDFDSPRLLLHATEGDRAYIAMEWCAGVSIAVAAQQARAARNRRRLLDLVSRLVDAYGRLHEKGVLHGDIHPGNCLLRDDGRVVLMDFGHARKIDGVGLVVDPLRTGIPQFHDPLMARELLAGRLPPAATPASEQYSIAALAYLLLTGLHPVEAPAIQDELLERIARRRPLPFASRRVAAWPAVEAVIGRGMAPLPSDRFPDVAGMARALASARSAPDGTTRLPKAVRRAFDDAVTAVRSLAPSSVPARDRAWFGVRAALALDDAELLAAADVIVRQVGTHWTARAVAARVARARSDHRLETSAITAFVAAVDLIPIEPELAAAILAASGILDGAPSRSEATSTLAACARQALERLSKSPPAPEADPSESTSRRALVELSLVHSGIIPVSHALRSHVETLSTTDMGDVWLWTLAHNVFAEDRFLELALASPLPREPLSRGFALLRLHQLTGATSWVDDASRLAAAASGRRLRDLDRALLIAELLAPEQTVLPPFLFPMPRARLQGMP